MWPPTFVRDGEECEWTRTKHRFLPLPSYAVIIQLFFAESPFDILSISHPLSPRLLQAEPRRKDSLSNFHLLIVEIRIISILVCTLPNGIITIFDSSRFFFQKIITLVARTYAHLTLQKFEIRIFSSIGPFLRSIIITSVLFLHSPMESARTRKECITPDEIGKSVRDRRRRYIIESNRIFVFRDRFSFRAGGRN